MPQISQLALVYQSQWFWLVLTLAVIFFVVGRGILPKVEATIDARDAKIAADLDEAQRFQDEAEASEEAWRRQLNNARADAQAVTAKAKQKAQADLEKKLAKADKDVADKIAAAEAELDAARKAALTELEAVASEATQDIVVKLTGTKVSQAEARAAVAGALANA
ncbi:MAG: ATPase [Alphaproteobacteria bacterium]|nr:MAG: ATPase [Alphaproteobacteria bacterium]